MVFAEIALSTAFIILAIIVGLGLVTIYLVGEGLFLSNLYKFYKSIGTFYMTLISVLGSIVALMLGYVMAYFEGLLIVLLLFVLPMIVTYLIALTAPSEVPC